MPQLSRIGQREPVLLARDGIRGRKAVEPHSRHLFAKSGLVQVPLSTECFAPFHAVAVLPALDCWLAPSNGHARRPSWANHWKRHAA